MAYKILHTIAYVDNQNIPLSIILAISANFDEFEQETTRKEYILETVIARLKEFENLIEAHLLLQDDLKGPSLSYRRLLVRAGSKVRRSRRKLGLKQV